MTSLVGIKVKLERVHFICPACGQQVEAVASDGQVKGYCAVAKQYVDFLIETQPRDGGGHFVKGNVPWNKGRCPSPSLTASSQVEQGNSKY